MSIFQLFFKLGFLQQYYSVADPGFSRGGAPTPKSAIIFHLFAKNCMKIKVFGPQDGTRIPGTPMGSKNAILGQSTSTWCPRQSSPKPENCSITQGSKRHYFITPHIFILKKRQNTNYIITEYSVIFYYLLGKTLF